MILLGAIDSNTQNNENSFRNDETVNMIFFFFFKKNRHCTRRYLQAERHNRMQRLLVFAFACDLCLLCQKNETINGVVTIVIQFIDESSITKLSLFIARHIFTCIHALKFGQVRFDNLDAHKQNNTAENNQRDHVIIDENKQTNKATIDRSRSSANVVRCDAVRAVRATSRRARLCACASKKGDQKHDDDVCRQ